jgi:hypothetical protein
MISFLLGPVLGLSPVVVLPLSIIEGLVLTVLVSRLAERYLFPMPQD